MQFRLPQRRVVSDKPPCTIAVRFLGSRHNNWWSLCALLILRQQATINFRQAENDVAAKNRMRIWLIC